MIQGKAPWVTSWGLASVFVVGARTDSGEVAWFALDAQDAEDQCIPQPLALSVMGATATVSLTLSWEADGDALVGMESIEQWQKEDLLATAIPSAGASGVTRRCILRLAETAERLGGSQARIVKEISESLADLHHDIGLVSHEIAMSSATGTEQIDQLRVLRSKGLLLAQDAAAAAVAAAGGAAMGSSHPAQRLAREATFYSIQAQTAQGRIATLGRLAEHIELLGKDVSLSPGPGPF